MTDPSPAQALRRASPAYQCSIPERRRTSGVSVRRHSSEESPLLPRISIALSGPNEQDEAVVRRQPSHAPSPRRVFDAPHTRLQACPDPLVPEVEVRLVAAAAAGGRPAAPSRPGLLGAIVSPASVAREAAGATTPGIMHKARLSGRQSLEDVRRRHIETAVWRRRPRCRHCFWCGSPSHSRVRSFLRLVCHPSENIR